MTPFPYKRIVVIGVTSSGKSTLAGQLANRLNASFIELDALHWEPHWQEAPLEVFRARVVQALQAPAWVVAGNYHVVRDLVWSQAEALLWLDYSFPRVLWQLTRRTFTRWWTQELLWGKVREPLWVHFKLWSEASLYHWLVKTYWRRKREYPRLFDLPEYQHLAMLRFSHPRETAAWLETIEPTHKESI